MTLNGHFCRWATQTSFLPEWAVFPTCLLFAEDMYDVLRVLLLAVRSKENIFQNLLTGSGFCAAYIHYVIINVLIFNWIWDLGLSPERNGVRIHTECPSLKLNALGTVLLTQPQVWSVKQMSSWLSGECWTPRWPSGQLVKLMANQRCEYKDHLPMVRPWRIIEQWTYKLVLSHSVTNSNC
jgi:hypothetical protein